MKKVMRVSIVACLLVLLFSINTANAELFNRGEDSLGNRLIYDDDLDITWYDYTEPQNVWQNQVNWASALTVIFGGTMYDDWRLPTALNQDGTGPCYGYNCTGSEMGHLFYTELRNIGFYDTSGNPTGCYPSGGCLSNKGDFQHLQQYSNYWSGTGDSAPTGDAWHFSLNVGRQLTHNKGEWGDYAIAVRSGDVAVVPEPISSILFLTGGALMAGRRYLSDRTHGRNG